MRTADGAFSQPPSFTCGSHKVAVIASCSKVSSALIMLRAAWTRALFSGLFEARASILALLSTTRTLCITSKWRVREPFGARRADLKLRRIVAPSCSVRNDFLVPAHGAPSRPGKPNVKRGYGGQPKKACGAEAVAVTVQGDPVAEPGCSSFFLLHRNRDRGKLSHVDELHLSLPDETNVY